MPGKPSNLWCSKGSFILYSSDVKSALLLYDNEPQSVLKNSVWYAEKKESLPSYSKFTLLNGYDTDTSDLSVSTYFVIS